MRDFIRDWQKWTYAERMLAGVIAVLLVAMPLGLVLIRTAGV